MKTRLRVKEVAESKGYNMSSLSRASDISFNTVKRLWTKPYKGAHIDTLLRVARVLNVQVTELIEEIPEQPPIE
jgi:DNA-binding Xre family transcriptional regulator